MSWAAAQAHMDTRFEFEATGRFSVISVAGAASSSSRAAASSSGAEETKQSGSKAKKARQYGVEVIGIEEMRARLSS